jgi:tRNA pseudouridine38/39 synthase
MTAPPKPTPKYTKKPKRSNRPFDFALSTCRPVALRIAYSGDSYHGFSTSDALPTIESHLFEALIKAKLIPGSDACSWSKCGRTDKGVSATGQTVSLYIRSQLGGVKWDMVRQLEDYKHFLVHASPGCDETMDGEPAAVTEELKSALQTLESFDGHDTKELDYVTMMNRLLPEDIRVLCWAPVDHAFDARFACATRKYHYTFSPAGLDIDKMKTACAQFEGTHDFRHFAVSMSNAETGYQ